MNQKICIAVLFVAICLCFTSALPTYGGLSLGLAQQQYPRGYGGFGGFGASPYIGSYGGVASVDPVFSNGFGSEYGRYGYNPGYGGFGPSYGNYYNRYNNAYGGNYGGGFQY